MPNLQSLSFFLPELAISGAAIIMIILAALPSKRLAALAPYFTIFALLVGLALVIREWGIGSPPLFWGLFILDGPAEFFKAIFIVTAIIVILFSWHSRELGGHDSFEYYTLILGMVLGMSLLAGASNILTIYLSLEFVSLVSYLLTGYVLGSRRSSEAALKYLLFGAVASGIFLYGASLFYGATGSLTIIDIPKPSAINYQLSTVLMLAGFLYKIAAVPMHAWCPDVYEGAPTPVTALLSVAPKAAGFAVLMRFVGRMDLSVTIAIVSAITMTFGNLAAITQTNVKRLLAYSSIAHAGYILMGVACLTPKGNEAVYFYFAAYLVMNLGAFLVVQIVRDTMSLQSAEGGEIAHESLEAYVGMGRRGTFGIIIASAMTIFLLSLTGVPPFVGFIGKFYIFSAAIDARLYWLAVIGIANSVISLYYYMRIVKAMFFDTAPDQASFPLTGKTLHIILTTLAAITICLGLVWQWLADITAAISI